jgi:hypothetical protein
LTGTIQNISIALTGAKAISFINWSMPENNTDKTAINYFEITLMGTHSNNTMSVRMAKSDQYLQIFSQKYVLSEGNYTSVSITAVDLYGKRSNQVQAHLINTTTVSMCAPNLVNSTSADVQQNEAAITGGVLGVLLLISVLIAAVLLVAIIILVHHHKNKSSDAVIYIANNN